MEHNTITATSGTIPIPYGAPPVLPPPGPLGSSAGITITPVAGVRFGPGCDAGHNASKVKKVGKPHVTSSRVSELDFSSHKGTNQTLLPTPQHYSVPMEHFLT
jgi:hypothetical protein